MKRRLNVSAVFKQSGFLAELLLLFTPVVLKATNPVYLKLPYGKRPDSSPDTVLVRTVQRSARRRVNSNNELLPDMKKNKKSIDFLQNR